MFQALSGVRRLFSNGKYPENEDDLFFRFESLPLSGKEYWFMHFVSDDDRQMILSFGRTDTKKMSMNGNHVSLNHTIPEKPCAFMGWFFDRRKKILAGDSAILRIDRRAMNINNGKISLFFGGNYPEYELEIRDNEKEVCNISFSAEKQPEGKKFVRNTRFSMGIRGVNYALDFKGKLNGKRFKGNALVQKVVVTGLMPPWRWARVVFKDKSVLSVFIPYLPVFGHRHKIYSGLWYFDAKKKKRFYFDDGKIKKISNKMWELTADRNKLRVLLESYESVPFSIKARGTLTYNEHLVKVKRAESGKSSLSVQNEGTGLLEDSKGFLV